MFQNAEIAKEFGNKVYERVYNRMLAAGAEIQAAQTVAETAGLEAEAQRLNDLDAWVTENVGLS